MLRPAIENFNLMTSITLITNGGPHPADKWAAVVASKIVGFIQIDEQSNSEAATAARKAKPRFAIAISDAVEPVFEQVMQSEKSKVEAGAITARNDAFQVSDQVSQAFDAVISAASTTPFSEHFKLADVREIVRNIVTQNILDAANISRSWAFDAKGL